MTKGYVFLNDDLVPTEKACLHVSDLSIQRGYGIFDFFRVAGGQPLFLDDHLERFFSSAREMRLPVRLQREELKNVIHLLIQKSAATHFGIRLTLTGGFSPDGYQISEPNLIVTPHPLSLPTEEQQVTGIRLITYPHRRQLPHVKTIDYLMAIYLQPHIKASGADDVLYQINGVISECPRANFFIVTQEGTVATPIENILHGITRRKVWECARRHFAVEERDVTVAEIKEAKEAFITSSTKRVLPVTAVDGITIGDGKPGGITRMLERNTGL